MIAPAIIIVHEAADLSLKLLRDFPDQKVDLLLAGAMIALNLTVGLGMIVDGQRKWHRW